MNINDLFKGVLFAAIQIIALITANYFLDAPFDYKNFNILGALVIFSHVALYILLIKLNNDKE